MEKEPLQRCTATNRANHQCSWELGHERNRLPDLDSLLVWNGKPVHGHWNDLGFWEVWEVK